MGVIAGVGMAIAGAEMNGIFRNPASPFTSGISAGAGLGAASRDLIVMGAGDETAKSLGVNVERTRICGVMFASFITAVIICFTGMIGFTGLVAPHITRMCIGGDNRFVLPASALFGAAFLVAADIIAREVVAPVIIPVGIITSFVGCPLFLYLIIRKKKEYL